MKLTGVHWLMWQRLLIALLMLRVSNASAAAQEFVEVTPGEQYRAGPLRSFLIGQGYRSFWTSPIRVPVLNLAAYAGGLTPVEQGGRQTRTLHLRGADGKAYVFRSVDKFMEPVLPPEFADTPLEALFQDATAFFLPSGALAVPPLLAAIGLLHVKPELYVMPDDARLGEFRQTFAGILGQLEERPEAGAAETPGFAGSRKVAGTDKVIEELRASGRSRIVEDEWLAARLTDFIIGDTDRGTDQWRWARFEDASRGYVWRPIARDRDWAFLHADGLLAGIAHRIFPKAVTFNRQLPSVNAL
ncbi:MAG TPA: hypothetical protein VK864_11780, partial [Longimicrobiales bacterium]|nr:hypothetical protein [Longimicrobiales bacterium]